jgi:HprK-related kinase B
VTSISIPSLAEPLLRAHPTVRTVQLRLEDFAVRVHTNEAKLADVLEDYFREWVVPAEDDATVLCALETDASPLPLTFSNWVRDPGKVGQKDAYADIEGGRAVRKVRTGVQYLLGSGHRIIFGPCLQNPNQVINFVVAQHINHLMKSGLALCHAAGVVHRGRGLAIAGTAGAGKSSLALHLMTRGLAFASNDRLFVGPLGGTPTLAGVPKQPRINPGTALSIGALADVLPEERRHAFEALDRDTLWRLEEKYDVDIARTFGPGRWALRAPAVAFLVLTWSHRRAEPARFSRVNLAERPDLLEAIMKPPGPFYEPAGSDAPRGVYRMSPKEYLDRLSGVPVYEASGGVDFDRAVRVCIEEYLGG